MSRGKGFFPLPGNSFVRVAASPGRPHLFETTFVSDVSESTSAMAGPTLPIESGPIEPKLYVHYLYGTDWYRQPGTKDQPLRSIREATKRLAVSGWQISAMVILMGRKPRHRRRTELVRRKENATRRFAVAAELSK